MTAALLAAACMISGTVQDVESGKPLPRTRVFARPVAASDKAAILRVADAQGAFCFEELAAGTYQVVAERSGYLATVYGARPDSDDGIPFEVDEKTELPPLTIRMAAGATIAGTVLDAEGQPLADANVQLSRKVWEKVWTSDQVRDTNSDERGGFRFSMLAPGTYYLSATPRGPDGRGRMLDAQGKPLHRSAIETFYLDSYTFAHATPIRLKAGEANTSVTLTILRAASRRLSGTVLGELGSTHGLSGRTLPPMVELRIEGGMGDSVDVPIGTDGTFSAEGLAAALYRYDVFNVDPGAEGRVDLAGGDVSGFVIEPRRTVDLQVKCDIPLMAIDRQGMGGRSGMRDEDGVVRFLQLPAGIYRLEPQENNRYVKSLRMEGREQPDAWLDLRRNVPTGMEVVIGSKPAAIEGRLETHERETHALAITVVAVDETRSGAALKWQTLVAGHSGEFALGSLAPGKWRLFAVEGFDDGPWGNPELAAALGEKSVAVELGEGETKKVGLGVIAAAEWEAALRKVGM